MSYYLLAEVMLTGSLSGTGTPLVPTAATRNVYTAVFGVSPETVRTVS